MKKIFLALSLMCVLVVGCNAFRAQRLLGCSSNNLLQCWEATDGRQTTKRSVEQGAYRCTRTINRTWGAPQDAWWISHVMFPPNQPALYIIHHNEGIQAAFDECMVRLGYRRVVYIEPDRYYEFY